jgi:hypothetical protein
MVKHSVDIESCAKARKAEGARLHWGRRAPFAERSNCSLCVVPEEPCKTAQINGLSSGLKGKRRCETLPVRLLVDRGRLDVVRRGGLGRGVSRMARSPGETAMTDFMGGHRTRLPWECKQ